MSKSVIINGKYMEGVVHKYTTFHQDGSVEFYTEGDEVFGVISEPAPQPEPEPAPEPEPEVPSDVVLGPDITAHFLNKISSGRPEVRVTIPQGRILAQPFTPEGDWNGRMFDIQEYAKGTYVSRRMWVSNTPGGHPMPDLQNGMQGPAAFGLSLGVYLGGPSYRCVLQNGTRYYLNIAHEDVSQPATRCIRTIN